MKTTMSFGDKNKRSNIISTIDGLGDAIVMTVLRTKHRRYFADKNFLIYDDETGHLRVGHGAKSQMETVSGVRVLSSVSGLPKKGKIDTLYVCLEDSSMYVWNPDINEWHKIQSSGGGGGGTSPQPVREQVVVLNNHTELPYTGKDNTLYVTKLGQMYVFDSYLNHYVTLANGPSYTKTESDAKYAAKGDSYTKTESDDRYAKKADVYTKTESDGRYAKKGDSYTKDESDDRYAKKGESYTKTESDAKYETKGYSYSKTESDNKYATKEELQSLQLSGGGNGCVHVKDIFPVVRDSDTQFILSKKPLGEIDFYVNGILYINARGETNYIHSSGTQTVTWVNTMESSGGFSLEGSIVVIKYVTAGNSGES